MKKHLPVIAIICLFFIGMGVCLYPSISSLLNQIHESYAIEDNRKAVEKMSAADLEKEKSAVAAYNESLLENHIVLMDPFDPDAFPVTRGNYEDLLALSSSMATVEIPKINVKLPVYHGTGEKTLKKGAGHVENTSLPMGGSNTHTVISAHTGLPSQKLFDNLDKLEAGDIFYIDVLDERLTYCVDSIKVVTPDSFRELMIINGGDYATLVTCTPYGKNTHRLLVRGVRAENDPVQSDKAPAQDSHGIWDILMMKFGLSLREVITFAAMIILTVIFAVAIFTNKKGKGAKNEKEIS